MEIRYLEWNIHAKGGIGYSIPQFICEYIKGVDIFVLTEFCQREGWDSFVDNMNEFDLYCSPFFVGYNQICIGIRKKLNYNLISSVTKDVCDVNLPEFLQVNIEVSSKEVCIIGTRVKTQSATIEKQLSHLQSWLCSLETFICLGDFNAQQKFLSQKLKSLEIRGPRIKNGYFSFVHSDTTKSGLDWIVSKGIDEIYNGYEDYDQSPLATYDWSFVTSKNGYGYLNKNDYLNINGLPDHAILKGMIKI